MGFPGGSVIKNLLASAKDVGSFCDPGRFPGEGNGNPLQYSSGKSHGQRSLRRLQVHGVTKQSDMTE